MRLPLFQKYLVQAVPTPEEAAKGQRGGGRRKQQSNLVCFVWIWRIRSSQWLISHYFAYTHGYNYKTPSPALSRFSSHVNSALSRWHLKARSYYCYGNAHQICITANAHSIHIGFLFRLMQACKPGWQMGDLLRKVGASKSLIGSMPSMSHALIKNGFANTN